MIDHRHIGALLPGFSTRAEPGRLRFFAKATGQSDPRYTDEKLAREHGWPGLPVPPTFLFCLETDGPDPLAVFNLLGVELGRVLHGEQSFDYHRMAFANELLRYQSRIVDIYDKKGGALEFIVVQTRVTGEQGEPIADLRSTLVVRNA